MLDQLYGVGGIPHSYGVSLTSECRRDDSMREAANIPPMARNATKPEIATAVQFSANRSALKACNGRLGSNGMLKEETRNHHGTLGVGVARLTKYIIGLR